MLQIPDHRTVAIVALTQDLVNASAAAQLAQLQPMPVPRVVHYQVTIDPDRVSPSREFIRFGVWGDCTREENGVRISTGKGEGDELTGWMHVDEIEIVETLAIADDEGIFRPVVNNQAEKAA